MRRHHRLDLRDSTALVTGATGGLGRAIAGALAARDARLLLSGRRAEELDRLADTLGARTVVADLARPEEVQRLAREAVAAQTDVLVANAALPASGLITELSGADVDRMLDVNLRAPIALARALVPSMIRRGRGHLVFVSSLSGRAAAPASSLYSATKFGLRGFALALRQDLAPHHVGVSVVAPGFIRDQGMFADTGLRLPPGVATRTPQDLADAVIRAIDRDRAEIDVAPAGLRIGALVGAVAPGPAARASRLLGSARIAAEIAARQRERR